MEEVVGGGRTAAGTTSTPSDDRGLRERLLDGTAARERREQIKGISTAMLEAGDGPPLVLLHGGIECGGVIWAPVIPALAQHHRLVVPDLPGLGESEPISRLDNEAFIDWFAETVRRTCEVKPALVAHSLLGSLAARTAARHGDLFRHLVLYASPGIAAYRLPVGLQAAAIRSSLRPSQRNSERFARWAFLDLDRARAGLGEWYDAFDAYRRSRATVQHVKQTMRWLIRARTRQVPGAELEKIKIGTDLVWGSGDRMVPPHLAQAASATFGWPLHLVDDAGHLPHIEQPEGFLRILSAINP